MEGNKSWSVVTTVSQEHVTPMNNQNVHSDNYGRHRNEQAYRNKKQGSSSSDYSSSNQSKNTDGQLSLKRQNFNPPSYQPNYKRPNLGVSTYLSDKRNQFNLIALKGDTTSDNQVVSNFPSSSASVMQSSNSVTNYQWTPANSVTNYKWTPNNQWNNSPAINNFQVAPAHAQNIQVSQANVFTGQHVQQNNTQPGNNLPSELNLKDANFNKQIIGYMQTQPSMEGKVYTNQNKQGEIEERIKEIYSETLKAKNNPVVDANQFIRDNTGELGSMYGSENAGRIGWGSDKTERTGTYGVDHKFGGKFKDRVGKSSDREGMNDKRFPGIDEKFGLEGGRNIRDQNSQVSGVVNQNFGNQDYSSILKSVKMGQQSSFAGNIDAERTSMNQFGKSEQNFVNNVACTKNMTGEENESKIIEKDDNVSDKERIKQMLIDHANKSVFNCLQPPPFNTFPTNNKSIVNSNIFLKSPHPPAVINTAINTHSSRAGKPIVVTGKPFGKSPVYPIVKTTTVNAVKSIGEIGKPPVKSVANSFAKGVISPATVVNSGKMVVGIGKYAVKSTVNTVPPAVSVSTNAKSTASVVKPLINTGKPPVKSTVNTVTPAVSASTNAKSTANVVKPPINTGKSPVKSTVNTVPPVVNASTNAKSTANVVKPLINTGKPPVKSTVNTFTPFTPVVSASTNAKSTANVVKPLSNTGKPPVKSTVNTVTPAVSASTNAKATANVVKPLINTGKPPVKSTVNTFTPFTPVVSASTNAKSTANVVKPLINTGKPPVKSTVNTVTPAVSASTNAKSTANAVKPLINTGKPPVKSVASYNSIKPVLNTGQPDMKSPLNNPGKPANDNSNFPYPLKNFPVRPSMGVVSPLSVASTKFTSYTRNPNNINNSTVNILKSALSAVNPNANRFNMVRNPLYPVVTPRANVFVKPMNPALNPVINAALQFLPRGGGIPVARSNSPMLMRYNAMPTSVFRQPAINNMPPRNHTPAFYAQQQPNRQTMIPKNRQPFNPKSISQGRFRYS